MNQGIWKALEEFVCGGVGKTIGKNKVAVPSRLYKIVYDPGRQEAIAFIMPNKALETEDLPLYIVTVRDVEEKTGLASFRAWRRKCRMRWRPPEPPVSGNREGITL